MASLGKTIASAFDPAERVRLVGVAGGAGEVELLAVLGVGRRGRQRGQRRRDGGAAEADGEGKNAHVASHHACTSGPGRWRYCVVIACVAQ